VLLLRLLLLLLLQNVSQSDNFYHFTLQLAAPYVASSASSSSSSSSARPAGRSWVLGCYTNDERREWLEAILNAKLPVKQQVCVCVCPVVIQRWYRAAFQLSCVAAAKMVPVGASLW
jgi:hypothetical protein